MTNRDLFNVKDGIEKMSDLVNVADINFAMTIARINDEVTKEIKIIQNGKRKPSDKHKEYLKEQQDINMKYAITKEDGTLQVANGNILIHNPKKYNEEINALELKYKDEVIEQTRLDEEFENFLDQEVKASITKIPKSLFPASAKVEHVKLLFSVIQY
jgi:hypothetical protein